MTFPDTASARILWGTGRGSYQRTGFPAIEPCAGDFDEDGDIDGSDLATFVDLYAGKDPLADLNHDRTVDTEDLAVFSAEFGRINCPH